MNRLYYIFLLAVGLGMVACSNDDELSDADILAMNRGAQGRASSGGYESRLLAPPGFERGVGYCYATGAEYLEGVTFNIFNLNYLDSIQYVKNLNFVSDDYTPYSEEQVITGETRSAVSKQLAVSASLGANFIVADISVSGNYSKGSVKESESVFAMKRTKRVAYCRDLQYKNVIMYYKETGDSLVFAPGFFAEWKELEGVNANTSNVSNKKVLDFINKWGRGFVARSFMGGVLEYTMQMDKSVLSSSMSAEMALNASVGLIIGVEASASTKTEEFQKMTRDRYSMDIHVRGGNVQAVTEVLAGKATSPQGIKEWMQSVNFSPTPESDQLKLCSMTDVKIASIANLFTGKVQEQVNYILRTNAQ
ncbi:MAG: hypothetical protein II822_10220 [Prevotella sp.]|nr:hypothetical protein [Prevotella sp.]